MATKNVAQPTVFRRMAVTKSALLKPQKATNPALARAVSLHLEGKLEAALKELTDSAKSGKLEPFLYTAIAHIQYELHEFEQAAATYTKLLELAPEHRTAHFNKAVCLAKLGRWEEAAGSFEKALRID